MRTIELGRGERVERADLERVTALPEEVFQAARAIIDDVRERGDSALRDYTLKFDGACPPTFRVPDEVISDAVASVDPAVLEALEKAHAQIRDFHQREAQESWFNQHNDGSILGMRISPLESVGIYVPGGTASYPSTVLMNAVPAKVAGVPRVVMATPLQEDGTLPAATLAAAAIAGVDEIYAMGGAQAIAALAYGTQFIEPVMKITGPGNAYVAAAKSLVEGDVAIDMVAGPSEVCILADNRADARVIAADLMAQAEHDPMASTFLVTTSRQLAEDVQKAVDSLLPLSPREIITMSSLDDHGMIILCSNLGQCIEVVNAIAPEHLEINILNPINVVAAIKAAGAIFIGPWSSEALGDYVAGPNHTLPTGGTARFRGPLSVEDFQVKTSLIYYSRQGFLKDAEATRTIATAEGLWAHALSVEVREALIQRNREMRRQDRRRRQERGVRDTEVVVESDSPVINMLFNGIDPFQDDSETDGIKGTKPGSRASDEPDYEAINASYERSVSQGPTPEAVNLTIVEESSETTDGDPADE